MSEEEMKPQDLCHETAVLMMNDQDLHPEDMRDQYWVNYMVAARNMSFEQFQPPDAGEKFLYYICLDEILQKLIPVMSDNPNLAIHLMNTLNNITIAMKDCYERLENMDDLSLLRNGK